MAFVFTMKKEFRVRKNEEFSKIIAVRHSLGSGSFVVYSSPAVLDHARVGLSVSKKLGNAVCRNKIKRQIRMMLQQVFDFENCRFDLIVIARKSYLDKSYDDNRKDLEKLIKKAIMKKYD